MPGRLDSLGPPQAVNDGKLLRTVVVSGIPVFSWVDPAILGGGGGGDPTLGGVLTGTASSAAYAAGSIDGTAIAATIKNPAAGTPGLRSLGTTSQLACAGNDSRLSDTRTPTDGSVTAPKLASGQIIDPSKIIVPSGTTSGYALITDGVSASWQPIPGTGGGLTWMVNVVADGGAKGDAKVTASSAVTVTAAGGSTVGLTGTAVQHFQVTGAGFVAGDVGKAFVAPCGTSSAPKLGTITARTDSTHVTVTFSTAPATSMSGGPAVWGTDDTTAINNSVASAGSADAVVGYPAKLYLILSQVNWAVDGVRHTGLGGFCHAINTGTFSKGGACFVSGRVTAGTMVDMTFGSTTHNSPVVEYMNFFDPMLGNGVTDLLDIKYCTRGHLAKCRFMWGKTQMRVDSGIRDVSWWQFRDNIFLYPQTTAVEMNTGDGAASGAWAGSFSGGEFNLNGGAKGIWFRGAAYFDFCDFKMDIDGNGTVGMTFDVTGGGNTPQLGRVSGIRFEKTSQGSNSSTGCIRVNGATGGFDLIAINIGGGLGGASAPAGFGIWLSGTGSGARCEGVNIVGGKINNCDVCLRYGVNTRNNIAWGTGFGGGGIFIQFENDASCIGNRVQEPSYGVGSDPLNTSQISWGAASDQCWIDGGSWQGGGSSQISFAGFPSNNKGRDGDLAFNTTTGKVVRKNGATWGAFPV